MDRMVKYRRAIIEKAHKWFLYHHLKGNFRRDLRDCSTRYNKYLYHTQHTESKEGILQVLIP